MVAGQNFIATFGNHGDTLLLATALFKRFLIGVVLTFYLNGTEAALACVLVVLGFITSHSKMVWFTFTSNAKVLFTLVASYSIVGHVLGCLF